MDNLNHHNSSIFDVIHDPSKLVQCDIATFTDLVVNLCYQNYFDSIQSVDILHNMNKLKDFREYFGYKDHPSIPKILEDAGNVMAKTSLSQLALPFFMEQLRIEKYYLGCFHPDLASVLSNIGQIYEKIDQPIIASNYLTEALSLLNNHNRKGRLYASVLYYLGLVNYHQSLFKDSMEYFNVAIEEYQNSYNDFDPTVAEVHMNVGQLQLEIGKLQDAMDNFLKALVIVRMLFGNEHSLVAECLYGIGLIHEARSEFRESIDVLDQALTIAENTKDNDDDAFAIGILHRIGLIYQSIEETENAAVAFQNLEKMINMKASREVDGEKLFYLFGFNIDRELIHAAAAA